MTGIVGVMCSTLTLYTLLTILIHIDFSCVFVVDVVFPCILVPITFLTYCTNQDHRASCQDITTLPLDYCLHLHPHLHWESCVTLITCDFCSKDRESLTSGPPPHTDHRLELPLTQVWVWSANSWFGQLLLLCRVYRAIQK